MPIFCWFWELIASPVIGTPTEGAQPELDRAGSRGCGDRRSPRPLTRRFRSESFALREPTESEKPYRVRKECLKREFARTDHEQVGRQLGWPDLYAVERGSEWPISTEILQARRVC